MKKRNRKDRYSRVVFVFETPPVASYYSRYGMELFLENGYEVAVIDLSKILNPASADVPLKKLIPCRQNLELFRPATKAEFKDVLAKQGDAFIWSAIPLYAESLWAVKAISRFDYGFLNNMDFFAYAAKADRAKTKSFWTEWSVKRLANAVFYRIPHNLMPVKKAKVVMAYSDESAEIAKHTSAWDGKTKFIQANTIDYCECMKLKRASAREISEPYIVFVDEYLPFHPDGIKTGFHLEPKQYYKSLRMLFEELQKATGKKVVIAAHPKADYNDERSWCYEGFDVFQFKTAEMILHSDAAILEYACLAKSMVVTYEKPSLFITTDELEENDTYRLAHAEVREKGVNIYNVTTEAGVEKLISSLEPELQISVERNKKEVQNYCLNKSHPNSGLLFEEVLLKAIEA